MLPQIHAAMFGKVNNPKRFEVKDGVYKEVDPKKKRSAPNPAYRTPKDGEPVGVVVTRQEKWRQKNKARVAEYMRDYRAKQKAQITESSSSST